jgi:hypothetical protein
MFSLYPKAAPNALCFRRFRDGLVRPLGLVIRRYRSPDLGKGLDADDSPVLIIIHDNALGDFFALLDTPIGQSMAEKT